MSKNIVEGKGSEAQNREDFKANKLMALFVLATVFVVALLLLNRDYSEFFGVVNVFRNYLTPLYIIQGVCALLFAAALVFFIIRRRKKVDESLKYITSTLLLVVASILFFGSLLFLIIGLKGIIGAVIAISVVVFIYYIYPEDFFLYSVAIAVGAALLLAAKGTVTLEYSSEYFVGFYKGVLVLAAKILSFLAPVAAIIITLTGFARNKERICAYSLLVGAAVVLVASVLSLFTPVFTIYALILLLATFLATAIVYTIKMI